MENTLIFSAMFPCGRVRPQHFQPANLPFSDDDFFQVALEYFFVSLFKLYEHDAVAELRMAGDDASADEDGDVIQPERGVQAETDGKRHHQLDVATAAAEVGGFEAHGSVGVFGVKFDLDMDAVTGRVAAFMLEGGGSGGKEIGRTHKSAPGVLGWVPRIIIGKSAK